MNKVTAFAVAVAVLGLGVAQTQAETLTYDWRGTIDSGNWNGSGAGQEVVGSFDLDYQAQAADQALDWSDYLAPKNIQIRIGQEVFNRQEAFGWSVFNKTDFDAVGFDDAPIVNGGNAGNLSFDLASTANLWDNSSLDNSRGLEQTDKFSLRRWGADLWTNVGQAITNATNVFGNIVEVHLRQPDDKVAWSLDNLTPNPGQGSDQACR